MSKTVFDFGHNLFRKKYHGPKDEHLVASENYFKALQDHSSLPETESSLPLGIKVVVNKYLTGNQAMMVARDEWGEFKVVGIFT